MWGRGEEGKGLEDGWERSNRRRRARRRTRGVKALVLTRVGKSESPHATVEAGLRVLARIIAREAVHDRQRRMERSNVTASSRVDVAAEITDGCREEVGR